MGHLLCRLSVIQSILFSFENCFAFICLFGTVINVAAITHIISDCEFILWWKIRLQSLLAYTSDFTWEENQKRFQNCFLFFLIWCLKWMTAYGVINPHHHMNQTIRHSSWELNKMFLIHPKTEGQKHLSSGWASSELLFCSFMSLAPPCVSHQKIPNTRINKMLWSWKYFSHATYGWNHSEHTMRMMFFFFSSSFVKEAC